MPESVKEISTVYYTKSSHQRIHWFRQYRRDLRCPNSN